MESSDKDEVSTPRRMVPAVDRAARLLAILEQERRPMSISDLARRLDASKGSVRDVLETLRSHGLLERDEDSKLYTLGAGLVRLGEASGAHRDLITVAKPHLTALAGEIGEVVLLMSRREDRLVILDKTEPDRTAHPISVSAHTGRTIPIIAGACGKVVLSHLEPEDRAPYLAELPAHTSRSVTDPDAYTAEFDRILADGYAVDDEEYMDGIRAVAAPVLDHRNQLVAVVLVSALSAALPLARLTSVGTAVAAAAAEVSAALGARSGEPTPTT